ncbi:PREDICTED: ataxin-7-like protein 2 [Cyprinodon variegatus]|uniref:ataxin-7-like protein 2 n=1 Tax=Cyprinodon variegatus TaxID=28743 RepID=UPI0007427C48|nr:PREDICTED: ataxin-7-like protein 2 [Cyprinodon variegatus]
MMAVRERAVKAMAAVDRRVPSLDEFVGQSWTAWADWAGVTAADGAEGEDCSRNGKKAAEAMSLSKEDMSIFGLYPGHDDFYLVVCSHCGQVVKPQAFEKHCERRHAPLAKLYGKLRSPTPAPQLQRPYHAHSPSHGINAPSASSWEGRGPNVVPPRAAPPSPSTPPQYRYSKNSKDGVRGLDVLAYFPGFLVDPLISVSSERECDLDKHCGVLDPDRKKVCTRLLTCNIHSIHQRRKVLGRSKNFDLLVAELKMRVREKALDGGFSTGGSPSPEAPREQAGVPHCRRPLASLPAFRCDIIAPAVCSFGSRSLGHGIYTFDRRLHHARWALSSMLEQHISAHLWKKIPQATELLSPTSLAKSISSSSPVSIATSSTFHSKVRAGSHISSSLKNASSSPSRGPGRLPAAVQSENSGAGFAGPHPTSGGRPGVVRQGGGARAKNPVGRPSKQMLKLREEAAAAAAFRKRKAPSQEGEHSGPERNCIVLQDRGPPPSTVSSSSSSSSSKVPPSSLLPHGQTNGTLSPGKPRPQPPASDSPAAKAVWTYKRTHPPLSHSSPPDPSSASNSHSRTGVGDSGTHGPGSGRTFLEHQGLKKRKVGAVEEHPPSSKLSSQRLPSSSSSSAPSSSPCSGFYPWKDSKSSGLEGDMEKKLGIQKPKLHH